jgi:hypothetical protein
MDGGFDYVDGDLAFYVQKDIYNNNGNGNGNSALDLYEQVNYTNDDPRSDVGYIVEVHYIGSPITTLDLEVNNLSGDLIGDNSGVNYVQNVLHGDTNESPENAIYFDDTVVNNQDTTFGLNEWTLQQSSIDPAYGVVSFDISFADQMFNSLIYHENGTLTNDDADQDSYDNMVDLTLNVQSSLLYDIITPHSSSDDSELADAFFHFLDYENNSDDINDSFIAVLDLLKADDQNIDIMIPLLTDAINNADDDYTTAYPPMEFQNLNSMPIMNISYSLAGTSDIYTIPIDLSKTLSGNDTLVILSDAPQNMNYDGSSVIVPDDTTLIGEFRILPEITETDMNWAFDANIVLKLNANTYDADNYVVDGGASSTGIHNLALDAIPTGEILNKTYTIFTDSSVDANDNIQISLASSDETVETTTDDSDDDSDSDSPDMSSVKIYYQEDLEPYTNIFSESPTASTAIWNDDGTAMAIDVVYDGMNYIVPEGGTPYPVPFNGGNMTSIENLSSYYTIDLSNMGGGADSSGNLGTPWNMVSSAYGISSMDIISLDMYSQFGDMSMTNAQEGMYVLNTIDDVPALFLTKFYYTNGYSGNRRQSGSINAYI